MLALLGISPSALRLQIASLLRFDPSEVTVPAQFVVAAAALLAMIEPRTVTLLPLLIPPPFAAELAAMVEAMIVIELSTQLLIAPPEPFGDMLPAKVLAVTVIVAPLRSAPPAPPRPAGFLIPEH